MENQEIIALDLSLSNSNRYLDNNSDYDQIAKLNSELEQVNIRFFNITKWVMDKKENNLDKLVNVYQVLSNEE